MMKGNNGRNNSEAGAINKTKLTMSLLCSKPQTRRCQSKGRQKCKPVAFSAITPINSSASTTKQKGKEIPSFTSIQTLKKKKERKK